MTQVLLKLAMLAAIMVLMSRLVYQLPVTDLPQGVEFGINWLLSSMYFFNRILDVPTFFSVVWYFIQAIQYFTMLVLGWFVVKWILRAS